MTKILILSVLIIIAFAGFVRYLEANSIFHPTRDMPATPLSLGLTFEDVYFQAKDNVRLNGWFVKSEGNHTTMLYFHGNAGNISHRLEKIAMFHELGLNVFIIDYRGYGKSEGAPNEKGFYQDALAAYDYLLARQDIDRDKIISYGDSLGGVVAIDLATKRKVVCLIVDSSFSSAVDVSRTIFPFVPTFILKTKMDSAAKVRTLTIPKLFIHSVNDEIIPFGLGKKLFDAAAKPKEFLPITGGHNTNHIDSRKTFMKGTGEFLKQLGLIK